MCEKGLKNTHISEDWNTLIMADYTKRVEYFFATELWYKIISNVWWMEYLIFQGKMMCFMLYMTPHAHIARYVLIA